MTKDRRLGRGLAALLGTQIEEGAQENANPPGKAIGFPKPSIEPQPPREHAMTRSEKIQSLAIEAHSSVTTNRTNLSPVTLAVNSSASSTATLELQTGLIDANPFQPRRQFNPSEIESLAESLMFFFRNSVDSNIDLNFIFFIIL